MKLPAPKSLLIPLKPAGRVLLSGLQTLSSVTDAVTNTDREKLRYHPVWLGTQVMPYSIVINARKTPRDIYDDG